MAFPKTINAPRNKEIIDDYIKQVINNHISKLYWIEQTAKKYNRSCGVIRGILRDNYKQEGAL